MSHAHLCIAAAMLCLATGCQKFDWEEEAPAEEEAEVVAVRPVALGRGTQNAPYTAGQVSAGSMGTDYAWYVGYAVGSTYSTLKNAVFGAETTYTSNILIADNPECATTADCVPVELRTEAMQQAASLYYNSGHYRQCIVLRGRFGQYFRTNGIRDVVEAYWLPDLDLSALRSTPTEWEEWQAEY